MMCRMSILLLLFVALCSCSGPVSTGTRHDPPHALIDTWAVYWWNGTDPISRAYLQETVREHANLVYSYLNGEPVPRTAIHFYLKLNDLQVARNAISSAYGLGRNNPRIITGQLPSSGYAFRHPLDLSIHVWAMPKLQGGEMLGVFMFESVIGDPQHLDPRWTFFVGDAWTLSSNIAARR